MDLILRGEPLRDRSAVAFALGPLVVLNVILAATHGACVGAFAVFGRDDPARPAVFLRTDSWGNAYEVVADMLAKEWATLAE